MKSLEAHTSRRPELALFDFDGTLTRKDTYTRFLCYAAGRPRFYVSVAVLLPVFVRYLTGRISHTDLKTRFLKRLLGGCSAARYREIASRFATEQVPQLLRQNAVDCLRWHQARGDRVIVVSASMREWLEPFCKEHDVELLCSEMEVREGRLTGCLAGPNCRGLEKVHRVQRHLDLNQFHAVHVYGDSRGDRELLAIAHYRWFRCFPPGLRSRGASAPTSHAQG